MLTTQRTASRPTFETTRRYGRCPQGADGQHGITWAHVPADAPIPEAGTECGVCYDCSGVFQR